VGGRTFEGGVLAGHYGTYLKRYAYLLIQSKLNWVNH